MAKQTECRNGCGRILEWDNNQQGKYKFVEAATGQLHKCPNYKAKQMSEYESNKAKYAQPQQQNIDLARADDILKIENKIEAILDRVNNSDVNILGMLGIQQNILNKIMGTENADEILRLEGEITELKEALKTLQNEKGFKNAGELQ